jgi:heat shock protein HslJ
MKNPVENVCTLLIITAVFATSCKSPPSAASGENVVFVPGIGAIAGIEWRLVEVRAPAGNPASRFSREELAEAGMENAYTLRFDKERLSGMGAPNRYSAPYEEGAGKALSIKAIAGTLMASFREPESLKEREYFNYLERVNRWDLIQNKLLLYTRNEQGEETVLVFEAV